jgi:flagellar hook protein FlgE
VLRSLFSGISGLRQHQTMMDVVGNNIANVNTAGFKSSSVVFEDTLSQMVRSAGAPSAAAGGVNPAQVGLGVQLGGISNNFGQGSAQTTNKATDLMIQGDGFFVVRNGQQDIYTRAGAFTFDSNGLLVNPEGMVVQGWQGANGTINTNGPLTDIQLPAGMLIQPTATSAVGVTGNIVPDVNASAATLGVTAYDTAGNAHPLSMVLTPDKSGGTLPYPYTIAVTDGTVTLSDPSVATPTLAFDTAGNFDPTTSAPSSGRLSVTLADGTAVTLDFSKVSQFGGPKSLAVTSANGAPGGTLQQFRIQPDGTVVGIFSNGQKQDVAQIATANFNNPAGLEKIGNTSFTTSPNSGLAQIGVPGSGGRGDLLGGALEMSNVDLAQEFTNLIIAQRGFQANSRVITSSDEMLQDLVNIKH